MFQIREPTVGGLDELKVWEVVGEGSAAFCPFAEKVSAMRPRGGLVLRKKGVYLCYVLSSPGDGRALSNLFFLLYVRIRRVQEKEA